MDAVKTRHRVRRKNNTDLETKSSKPIDKDVLVQHIVHQFEYQCDLNDQIRKKVDNCSANSNSDIIHWLGQQSHVLGRIYALAHMWHFADPDRMIGPAVDAVLETYNNYIEQDLRTRQ